MKPICMKCNHFNYKIEDIGKGYRCRGSKGCPALWDQETKDSFVDSMATASLVIEALCLAASPDFGTKNYKAQYYADALANVLDSMEGTLPFSDLSNLYLFRDEIDEESHIVSNITQLLGDKLEIRTVE